MVDGSKCSVDGEKGRNLSTDQWSGQTQRGFMINLSGSQDDSLIHATSVFTPIHKWNARPKKTLSDGNV